MTTQASTTQAATAPAADLRAKLARMRAAQRTHGVATHDERIDRLGRLEGAVLARKDAIVAAISRDFGNRSATETLAGEIFAVKAAIRHARAHLHDWMEAEDRDVHWAFLPAKAQVVPQPVGVVGVISPWNYPVQLALSPIVSAIAAGNRVMLKPSELVPETVAVLGDVLADAFGGDGVDGSARTGERTGDHVCMVTGGPEVGEAFSRLPFDHLLFTGSTRVGKLVMRAASENLVPITLELGGKSPVIVAPDYPVHTAAERIMAGKLFSVGQTCVAPDYVLIPRAAAEAFVDACKASVARLYPTLRDNPDYTTIITDAHLARLHACADDARSRGARVIEVNPARESFEGTRKMAPLLVLDATDAMLVLEEEIFGPILPIVTYGSIDEALAFVDDRPRPLALYCFSHDEATVDRVVASTMSGAVSVNDTLIHLLQDDLPLGGIGPSGMGRYHGREGFETFTMKRPVFRQSRVSARSFLLPPYGPIASGILRILVGK
jgi:coniferyl-aldehyde dehydrogenase